MKKQKENVEATVHHHLSFSTWLLIALFSLGLLKLTGLTDISWWVVGLPLLLPVAFAIGAFFVSKILS